MSRARERTALPSLTDLARPLQTAAPLAALALAVASLPDLATASSAEQQASMEPPPVGLAPVSAGWGGGVLVLAAAPAVSVGVGAAVAVGTGSAATDAAAVAEGRGTV